MTKLEKPVRRVTQTPLDGTFAKDRDRRIVVSLIPGDGKQIPDLIDLRPERTRRSERIAVADVYRYAVRCRVNREMLERAREIKDKRQRQRESRRLDAAERRLRDKAKKDQTCND